MHGINGFLFLSKIVVIIQLIALSVGKSVSNRGGNKLCSFLIAYSFKNWIVQGWGVAVIVGVPSSDAVFKTNPYNFLDEKTVTGTTFGNYKPKTGLPTLVDMFMNNVSIICLSLSLSCNWIPRGNWITQLFPCRNWSWTSL